MGANAADQPPTLLLFSFPLSEKLLPRPHTICQVGKQPRTTPDTGRHWQSFNGTRPVSRLTSTMALGAAALGTERQPPPQDISRTQGWAQSTVLAVS